MNIVQETVAIENKLGLHARAAAVFVQLAHKFQSDIRLKKTTDSASQEQDTDNSLNSGWVNGKSILNVMTLDASIGSQILIKAKGPDAQQALERLVKLINDKFGEKE